MTDFSDPGAFEQRYLCEEEVMPHVQTLHPWQFVHEGRFEVLLAAVEVRLRVG